jgi:hypothetical protein
MEGSVSFLGQIALNCFDIHPVRLRDGFT